jgi:hypothetical protein
LEPQLSRPVPTHMISIMGLAVVYRIGFSAPYADSSGIQFLYLLMKGLLGQCPSFIPRVHESPHADLLALESSWLTDPVGLLIIRGRHSQQFNLGCVRISRDLSVFPVSVSLTIIIIVFPI